MSGMESTNELENTRAGAKEWEDAMAAAAKSGETTAVTTSGMYGDRTTVGVIVAYDAAGRVATLKTRAGTMRIALDDVVGVSRL